MIDIIRTDIRVAVITVMRIRSSGYMQKLLSTADINSARRGSDFEEEARHASAELEQHTAIRLCRMRFSVSFVVLFVLFVCMGGLLFFFSF